MSEIITGIYIFNQAEINDPNGGVKCHKPNTIINVEPNPDTQIFPNCEYFHFPLMDDESNSAKQIAEVLSCLHVKIKQGKYPIILHCKEGKSRSPALVAMYLFMALYPGFASLDEAFEFVKRQRTFTASSPYQKIEIVKGRFYESCKKHLESGCCSLGHLMISFKALSWSSWNKEKQCMIEAW